MRTVLKTTIKPSVWIGIGDYPAVEPGKKLAILRSIRGVWKNRKPDPVKELQKMRKGWERNLPAV